MVASRFRGSWAPGGWAWSIRPTTPSRTASSPLKTLKKISPQALLLFKNEFRALADLHHPNLIQLHELFSEPDGAGGILYFFTMELLDAQELSSCLRLEEAVPPSSLDSFGQPIAASGGEDPLGEARTLATEPAKDART